jgi:HD-GYP domain-containing protein (c-di-GMP phosphodiesterase class II)
MLKELMVGLARSLTASIDAKDEYTYGHSERVARVAMEIAAELGLDDDEQHDVYLTGLLHDIGKIGVADSVLQKPAPLTAEETLQIQKHVVIGHKILSGLHPISHLLPGVLHHHERYDGTGYPEGLRGDAIPMLARIIAVADSYDAMTSSRPYRPGMSLEQAEQILADGAGVQWDPLVIQAFLKRRQRIHAIRQRGLGDSLQCALDGALREDQFDKTGSSLTAMTRA